LPGPHDQEVTPDPEIIAQVKKWNERVEQGKKAAEEAGYYASIKEHRNYVRGVKGTELDEKEALVKTNLVYSTMASALPLIYAKNPEIAITPTEAVHPAQYPVIKIFAKTLELVVNRMLKDAKLKKRAKATLRSAMTTKIGWVKIIYQRELGQDPIIVNRINDVQDNIQRIEHLMQRCEDKQEHQSQEADKGELHQQIKALESQVEVSVAEGIVIDRILSEDFLIDPRIKDFDCYADADWMGHRIWYSADGFAQAFERKPGTKAKAFGVSGKADESGQSNDKQSQYAVWELWQKSSNTVFTLCEGDETWAREPYQPERLGEQWYCFFPLGLHLVDGQFMPMSTVELLKGLQDEYEETRDDYREVRQKNKPHYLTSSETPEKDIRRKVVAGIGEVVIVDANGQPLNQVFDVARQLPIDPAQYDTSQIRADLEFVSNLGDAARGAVVKAKTATEANIMQSGLASRTTEMQDASEDWIQDIAQYTAEVLLQELTPPQVERIAGQGAVWPSMSKNEIFDLVQIVVRAGTSGKPNKMQEQKTWLEFMPQLRELITQVAELRDQGKEDMAEVMIKVAQETIRRFDERLDVEEFLPQKKEDDSAQQMQQAQAMQQQIQQQMDEMQKQMALLESQIRKNNASALKDEVDATLAAKGRSVPSLPQTLIN